MPVLAEYYSPRHQAKLKDPSWRQENNRYRKQYRVFNINKHLFHSVKTRAKRLGIKCTLTLDDIKIPEVCPVFKTDFIYGNQHKAASIDRIDPDKGYTKDNIQVISKLANSMKSNASVKQLKEFSEWINQSIA